MSVPAVARRAPTITAMAMRGNRIETRISSSRAASASPALENKVAATRPSDILAAPIDAETTATTISTAIRTSMIGTAEGTRRDNAGRPARAGASAAVIGRTQRRRNFAPMEDRLPWIFG